MRPFPPQPPESLDPSSAGAGPLVPRPGSPFLEPMPRVVVVERSAPPQRHRPRWRWPLALFVLTCLSTWAIGGPAYAFWVMLILTAHELGHYFQAVRYRVPVSLPYFIPMPITILGTLGAVIAMPPRTPDRRSLFDIAVTGPLAGLFPALALSAYGLSISDIVPLDATREGTITLGDPLVLQWMTHWILGPIPEGSTVLIHPIGFAGWVGLLVTALNLLPIGQLDGGHILYALLRKRAHVLSTLLLVLTTVIVPVALIAHFYFGVTNYLWGWWLFVGLLHLIGARHPPTLDDDRPLGTGRTVLGWLLLAYFVIGFTPQPFSF